MDRAFQARPDLRCSDEVDLGFVVLAGIRTANDDDQLIRENFRDRQRLDVRGLQLSKRFARRDRRTLVARQMTFRAVTQIGTGAALQNPVWTD